MVLPFPPSVGTPPLPGLAPPLPPPPAPMPFNLIPIPGLTDLPVAGDDEEELPEPRRRKPRMPRPTLDQLRLRADRIVDFWNLRDQRMDEDYALYRLSRSKYKGQGELILRNIPWVMVERAAALLGKQVPNIDVIPAQPDLHDEAQRVEDYLRFAWERWNRRWVATLHNNIRRSMAHYLALRGWTSLRIQYDSEGDEDDSAQYDPVVLKPVDPRQVYPSVGDKGLRFVVHRYYTTITELVDEWPDAKRLFSDVEDWDSEKVEVTGYYDDWYHAVWCDSGVIKPVSAHEYGFVPWIIATGYGSDVRATNTRTNEWTAECGVAIFHGIKDAYRQMNKVLSQLATEVARAANPPLVFYYEPGLSETPKEFEYEPGEITYLIINKEKVEPIRLSPNPSDAGPLLQALKDDVDMGGLPPILFGAVGENPSGYAQALMSDAAEATLQPLIEAMLFCISEVNRAALKLIRDHHDGPVGFVVRDRATGQWRTGVTIDPELIEEVGVETHVTFKQISPRDQTQMAQVARMLTEAKLISLETARDEYLGLDNPSRENERVLHDLIYLDEEVVKVLRDKAVQKASPELWLELLAQRVVGQPPQPPQPPGPPPGMPPSGAGPGLPPQMMPPIQQAMMTDPLAGLTQSLGSMAGGAGIPAPVGIPGGGLPAGPPVPIPGLV